MRSQLPSQRPGVAQPLWWCGVLAWLLVAGACMEVQAVAAEPESAAKVEYQVKAGFLVNFGKLTDWPLEAERATNAFRIAVMDEGEALEVIRATLEGKQIKGRPVEVKRFDPAAEPGSFEMVFVTRSQGDRWKEVLHRMSCSPVLTVGECEGFAQAGGRINFIIKEQKIRFEVNLESASSVGLKISSKMAGMATLVGAKEAKP